jgi:hypothetical protein
MDNTRGTKAEVIVLQRQVPTDIRQIALSCRVSDIILTYQPELFYY